MKLFDRWGIQVLALMVFALAKSACVPMDSTQVDAVEATAVQDEPDSPVEVVVTAGADSFEMATGETRSLPLFANDTVRIAGVEVSSVEFADRVNNEELIPELTQQPGAGELLPFGTDPGTDPLFDTVGVTFFAPGNAGEVAFAYSLTAVSDPENEVLDSDTATVTIDVVRLVANDDSAAVQLGQSVVIDLVGNDDAGASDAGIAEVEIVGQPTQGQVETRAQQTFLGIGEVSYTPTSAGQDSFTYRFVTPFGVESNVANVTITTTDPDDTADIDASCEDADGNIPPTCQFDDVSLFVFTSCPANFGAGLVCDPAVAAVTHNRIPDQNRSITDITSEVIANAAERFGTRIFEFEFPTPDQDVQRLPSDAGEPVVVTVSGGSVTVSQDGAGGGPAVSNVVGNPLYVDNDTVMFAVDGQTVSTLTIPENGIANDGSGDQILVRDLDGLSSTVFMPQGFDVIRVLIYVHSDGETDDTNAPVLQGFLIERTSDAGTSVAGGFTFPLVPDPALQVIADAGGANPNIPIVITTVNRSDPIVGIYPADDAGAGGGGAGGGADAGSPVTTAGGPGVGVPPPALTPLAAVCPNRPTGVRCQAGATEKLLVTDSTGEVPLFDAVNGQFLNDFFLGGSVPNFIVESGWQSAQGPDNCVVVSDSRNGLWLYDTDGMRIVTDGSGNTADPGSTQPLIAALDVDVRGFDFHSPDGGTTHNLYAAVNNTLVRYDYAVTGNSVLSNRTVLVDEPGAEFNEVTVIDNVIYASDQAPDSTAAGVPNDLIRTYSLAGQSQGILINDFVTPYQIVELFDGSIGMVSFGTDEIRIVNAAGDTVRSFNLGDGDADNNDNPRGLFPQRDGNYLVAGRSELGVSTLNRSDESLTLRHAGNSERFIGSACLDP